MDAVMERALAVGGSAADLEPLRQMIRFPDTYPAFAQIEAGPEGTRWVQRIRDFTDADPTSIPVNSYRMQRGRVDFLHAGARDWDVFDADGRYLGVVSMPDRFTPVLFAGSLVYGVWRDDLDVEYVLRARITP